MNDATTPLTIAAAWGGEDELPLGSGQQTAEASKALPQLVGRVGSIESQGVYANRDDDFYASYARRTAEIKAIEPSEDLPDRILAAFNSVYRLVALDIDGTLTVEGSAAIDEDAARLVATLLTRGVEVLLVTGRGRDATRAAAEQLRHQGAIADNLMSRLSALTNNGVVLLETAPGDELLRRETALREGLDLEQVREAVDRTLDAAEVRHDTRPHALSTDGERKLGALRVDLRSDQDQDKAMAALTGEAAIAHVKLTTGRYAMTPTIDLTPLDKAEAIAMVAQRRGIDDGMVLRIGDRGADGENDFAMLNSPAGFTVGSVSSSQLGCWPVLSDDGTVLAGTEATRALIDGVLLFPPLSVAPEDPADVLSDLLRVQEISERRAREELRTFEQRLRIRAALSAGGLREAAQSHSLQLADLVDPRSGAVRLRDWELPAVPDSAQELFDLPHIELPPPKEERHDTWSMWSDTGVLLRGPRYYLGLVDDEALFSKLADSHADFLERGASLLRELGEIRFSLVNLKLTLGLLDYARNASLQGLVVAFATEDEARAAAAHAVAIDLSDTYVSLLTDPHAPWPAIAVRAADVVSAACAILVDASDEMRTSRVYGYRECDSFVENFMAAEIALRDLRDSGAWDPGQPVMAVGLANGGAELPAILSSVAKRQGSDVIGALLRLSTYGEAKLDQTEKVRRGDADYVRGLRDDPGRFMVLGGAVGDVERLPAIVCDDNLTTAISLQHARDVLLLRNHAVIGAAVVRYPSTNRAVHMDLHGHGFPDPSALFGYIRGLVAPSPYTRLVVPGDKVTGVYRNRRGRFNKAKERLETLVRADESQGDGK